MKTPGSPRTLLNFLLSATWLGLAPGLPAEEPSPSLKSAFKDYFMVGVALNRRQFTDEADAGAALALREFNSISPENALKWGSLHPRPGPEGYDFQAADRFVEFGEKHKLFLVGHCLVWHSQTPRWVFQGEGDSPPTREVLLQRMQDHIRTVVGRYKGRVKAWDVVNEALNDDGTLRDTPWLRTIGEDYLAKAFEFAHEADPAAELRYNDYSLEKEAKRNGAIALIKKLLKEKVPISGLGSQTHANLLRPSAEALDQTLTAFGELGLPISITELDVNASQRGQRFEGADIAEAGRAVGGGVVGEVNQKLADQYTSLFRVFLKHHKNIKLVTFWGVTDRDSWRRSGTPLLFDENGQPKPAYHAVLTEARKMAAVGAPPPPR